LSGLFFAAWVKEGGELEKRHLNLPQQSVMGKQLEKVHLLHRILWIQQKLGLVSVVFPTDFWKSISDAKLDGQIPLVYIRRASAKKGITVN
jgi:hypothetical protein